MKRIVAIVIALVVMCVSVSAGIPEFLTESYNNYTANYSFTMSFKGGDDINALLEETGVMETIGRRVDVKALISGMLSSGTVMTVKANISDDFKKAQMSLTSDIKSNISVNKNLNLNIEAKMGVWLRLDLEASEPVFEIVYTSPMYNKYILIDLFDFVENDEEKAQIIDVLNKFFNKDTIDIIKARALELLEKYSNITMKGAVCTIQIDNAGLIGIIKEFISVITDMTDSLPSIDVMGEIISVADEEYYETEEPSLNFDNLQILGKDGITIKYSLFSGKISSINIDADFSIDVSKIFESTTGEEWQYQAKGILDFGVKSDVKLTNIGKTKVDFPTLNDENSFNYIDTFFQYEEYEYEESYPWYYAYATSDELPVVDGEYYIPLRDMLEYAYEDTVEIAYSKGVIDINCKWFDKFDNLKVDINSGNIYADNVLRKTLKVMVSNGITYVGASVFEDIFGWELYDITHYILEDYYEIGFCTES